MGLEPTSQDAGDSTWLNLVESFVLVAKSASTCGERSANRVEQAMVGEMCVGQPQAHAFGVHGVHLDGAPHLDDVRIIQV